jgi:hypothetical protein
MDSFGMELEFSNPSSNLFKVANEKLLSSKLLSEAFFNYIYNNFL